MGSATKTFLVTLAAFGALFLFAMYAANSLSWSSNQFGRYIGHITFRCVVAGLVTGFFASRGEWSWPGIITVFVITFVVISAALLTPEAKGASVSVDGDWVGQGERTLCGNPTGSVSVGSKVQTKGNQAGCPDCLQTSYARIVIDGKSTAQVVNVSPDGAVDSDLNNIGTNGPKSLVPSMKRKGNPFSAFTLVGNFERMNYQCNNLGQTGEQIHVELSRP